MPLPTQIPSAVYALGAVGAWGISDFLGGYTARRFNSFFLATLGHAAGFSMIFAIAATNHMALPAARSMAWAMLAGASRAAGAAAFCPALLRGETRLALPLALAAVAGVPPS